MKTLYWEEAIQSVELCLVSAGFKSCRQTFALDFAIDDQKTTNALNNNLHESRKLTTVTSYGIQVTPLRH